MLVDGHVHLHPAFNLAEVLDRAAANVRAHRPNPGAAGRLIGGLLLTESAGVNRFEELADHVGSTTQIIRAACEMPQQKFIVATDQGIFYKLQQAAPDKTFIIAPTAGQGATCRSCANCPWMAMNDLEAMAEVFDRDDNEIHVPEDLAARAMMPLERMLAFADTLKP